MLYQWLSMGQGLLVEFCAFAELYFVCFGGEKLGPCRGYAIVKGGELLFEKGVIVVHTCLGCQWRQTLLWGVYIFSS